MGSFANTFAWSVSRQKTFKTCKRQYYYLYYGKWPGWNDSAPPETRLIYRLSKMVTLRMLAGNIVHKQIYLTLSNWRQGRVMSLEQTTDIAIERLRSAWKESRDGHWRERPKRFTNLFEHYYAQPVSDEDTRAAGDVVRVALASFYHSQALARALATPTDQWKTIEEFLSFNLEGVPVKMRMDFALQSDDKLHIFDWKTGRKRSSDPDQLFAYALYGESVWGFALDDIALASIHLNPLVEETFLLPGQHRDAFVQGVVAASQAMRDHLADPINNIAHIDQFPMTDNLNTCRRCNFQELCYGGAVDRVSDLDGAADEFEDD